MSTDLPKSNKNNNFVTHNLHTVWIGGPLPDITKSYLKVWRDINPDYTHITWIDTDNKFVALYNNAVKELREYTLKQYLVGDSNTTANDYYDQAVKIERGIRENVYLPHGNDIERIKTIKKIAGSLGDNKVQEYRTKIETIESSFVEMIDGQQGHYQYVSALFEQFSEMDNLRATALKQIYEREINDRGNLAAASDILRLVALQTQGGVYIDTDLLPLVDWDLLNETGDFPASENTTSENIYSKKVYLEIEKYKKLPGSKTNNIRSGLSQGQIDKIQELTKENQLFKQLNELSAAHFYSDNSYMGWTNAKLACNENNNFANALMDRVILNYNALDQFHELYSGKYDADEIYKIAIQISDEFGLDVTHEEVFIGSLTNYYRDSIVPERAQATATLYLTGPTMLSTVIENTEAVRHDIIKNETIASLYTVEETFSSWSISQFSQNSALYLDKLKFGIALNNEEKKMLRDECFDVITEKKEQATHLPDIAMKFLKDFNSFTESQLNLLIQAYEFSDKYIDLAKHAANQLGIEQWSPPAKDYFLTSTVSAEDNAANSFNYEKQLIIQLQGDETSFLSAQALFAKHPKQSEWLQRRDGQINDIFTWSQDSSDYHNINTPLVLEKPGAVRITLVGHCDPRDDVTRFAGMNAEQLGGMLGSVFDKIGTHTDQFHAIQLNLTGCSLLNSSLPLEQTLPGQLAFWMKNKADALGLDPEKVSVVAYEYPLRLVENGKKEIFVNSKWINKEVAAIKGMLNKTVLGWDNTSKELVKRPLTLPDITHTATAVDSTMKAYKQLGAESQQQLLELHEQTSQQLREALYQQKRPTEHSIEIEQKVIQALKLTNLSQEWNTAALELHASSGLDEHWHTSFTTRPLEQGHEVLFIHESTGEKKWINTEKEIFHTFGEQYQTLTTQLSNTLSFDPHTGEATAKPNVFEGDAVHTLNAAFLLQALMGQRPQQQGSSDALSWPMQLQNYVGLIQPTIGLAEDAVHLGGLVTQAIAGVELKPLAQTLSALHASPTLGSVMPALPGLLLDAANLTGIIAQLATTDNPIEIAVASTNLTMATLTTGVNVAALVTSFIPAAAGASAVLGLVAVPLAGIAAGLPALVEGFSTIAQSCEATFKAFDFVQKGIENPTQLQNLTPKETNNPLLSLGSGAVVSIVDFQQNSVTYGNVTMIGTDPNSGSGHTRVGGFDSFFSGPNLDTKMKLDIYLGLGLSRKQQPVELSQAQLFYLPSGINKHYRFDYDFYSFHRGAKAPALRKLSEYYKREFLWHFNAFVSDYAVSHLTATLFSTQVQVLLDNHDRTLVIPTITEESSRNHLSYYIAGHGGKYTLVLPSKALRLEIAGSTASDEHWTIDIESVLKSSTIEHDNVILGAVQPQVLRGMTITRTGITIGAQTIAFTSNPPKQVLLIAKLDESGVSLGVNVNLESGKQQSFLISYHDNGDSLKATTLTGLAHSLQLSGIVPLSINGQQGLLNSQGDMAVWQEDPTKNTFRLSQGTLSCVFTLPGTVQILANEQHILLAGSINLPQGIIKFITQPSYQASGFSHELQQLYCDDNAAVNALEPLLDMTFETNKLINWLNSYAQHLYAAAVMQLSNSTVLSIKTHANKQFTFVYHSDTTTTGYFILNSANWSAKNCIFEYTRQFGSPVLIANANNIPELNLSAEDIDCRWCDVKTEMIMNINHPSASVTLPIQASRYSTVFIQTSESGSLTLTLNETDFFKERFQQVDADLVIQYGKSSIIKIANAINPNLQLLMNFTNKQAVTVNDIIISAIIDSEAIINTINQYFKLDDVVSALKREDGVISFTGLSGLCYEMRPFEFPQKMAYIFVIIGYQGNTSFVFPERQFFNYIPAVIRTVNNQSVFNKKTELRLTRRSQHGPLYLMNDMLKLSDLDINYLTYRKYLTKLSDSQNHGNYIVLGEYSLDLSGLYATPQMTLDLIAALETMDVTALSQVISHWLVSLGQGGNESHHNAAIIGKDVEYILNDAMIYSSGQTPILSWDSYEVLSHKSVV